MKYCPSCNIYFNSDSNNCSFCNSECTNSKDVVNVQKYKDFTEKVDYDKRDKNYKLITILVCLITIISNVLMYKTNTQIFASYVCIIAVSICCIAINNMSNKLIYYHCIFYAISKLLDLYIFKTPITIVYSLPIISITFLLTIFTSKGMYKDAFGIIVFDIVLCFIPYIILSENYNTTKIPAYCSMIFGIIAIIILISKKETLIEIKKRLHL